jgi:hypothetical protein
MVAKIPLSMIKVPPSVVGEFALALLCIAGALVPFLAPRIPVANDVPRHVLVAEVMAHYNDAPYAFNRHFALDYKPRSTLLPQIVLAGFARLIPPFDAVKLFYLLSAIAFWLGVRFMAIRMGKPPIAALVLLPLLQFLPAYGGNLHFHAGLALYPLLLGILLGSGRGARRVVVLSVLLVVMYGFHIVVVAVATFTIIMFIVFRAGKGAKWTPGGLVDSLKQGWPDLIALLPSGLLLVYAMSHLDPAVAHVSYDVPALMHLKNYFAGNVYTLTKTAGYLNLGYLALFGAAAVAGCWRVSADRRLTVTAASLLVIGILMPIHLGAWYGAGQRTLPFAMIAALGAISLSRGAWRMAAWFSCALLLTNAAINTRAALNVQKIYAIYLSGLPVISYGSRILPVFEDLKLGGNEMALPMAGIDDAYNIYRGGSSPYCSAFPAVHTNATPLRLKFTDSPYTYKFEKRQERDYRGVSRYYDYVILFGNVPDAQRAADDEMTLAFINGPLRIYRSRLRH